MYLDGNPLENPLYFKQAFESDKGHVSRLIDVINRESHFQIEDLNRLERENLKLQHREMEVSDFLKKLVDNLLELSLKALLLSKNCLNVRTQLEYEVDMLSSEIFASIKKVDSEKLNFNSILRLLLLLKEMISSIEVCSRDLKNAEFKFFDIYNKVENISEIFIILLFYCNNCYATLKEPSKQFDEIEFVFQRNRELLKKLSEDPALHPNISILFSDLKKYLRKKQKDEVLRIWILINVMLKDFFSFSSEVYGFLSDINNIVKNT